MMGANLYLVITGIAFILIVGAFAMRKVECMFLETTLFLVLLAYVIFASSIGVYHFIASAKCLVG